MISITEQSAPLVITSRKSIKYQPSSWGLNEFQIRSGEVLCRGCILKMKNSIMIWIGDCREPRLGEIALGMPGDISNKALATPLIGSTESIAPQLATRLAAALHQPVYVCCGITVDRFTRPLIERAIISKLKDKTES